MSDSLLLTAAQLREKFREFFAHHNHALIPSASLVPDNDPTALFTTAGMHPLVPYLLGQPHPLGNRLANVQKCIRTTDIEEVGDNTHQTFFEMLGNWSLGDYFKKEAIEWSFAFLTNPHWLGLDPKKLVVTIFEGDEDAPEDTESAKIWLEVFTNAGLTDGAERIFRYPKSENWWGPAGQTGPCGPDTEIFYFTGEGDPVKNRGTAQPSDSGGPFVEIWNNVFMQYEKKTDGSYEKLSQHNVDTGLGLERMVAIINWLKGALPNPDPYRTDLFAPTIEAIMGASKTTWQEYDAQPVLRRSVRIAADHLRAATFIVSDAVTPSNKERGYVLRRLIRRSARELYKLNIPFENLASVVEKVVETIVDTPAYKDESYFAASSLTTAEIVAVIRDETSRFATALRKGLSLAQKMDLIDGSAAFNLYQNYGFPLEMSEEIALEKGQSIDKNVFREQFSHHQDLSRQQSAGVFKGGLADHSAQVTKYHTATHLLHAALQDILGPHVRQEGSNITAERLRFDFRHPQSLTQEELRAVEDWMNQKIQLDLPVQRLEMPKTEAEKLGAMAFFREKYGDVVSVYRIGNEEKPVSLEFCGGPHVSSTGEIGPIHIVKQGAVGSGIRRLYLANL